jgi:hypothetical protein
MESSDSQVSVTGLNQMMASRTSGDFDTGQENLNSPHQTGRKWFLTPKHFNT